MTDFMYRHSTNLSFCGWCGKVFTNDRNMNIVLRRVQTSPRVVNVISERWCEDCEYPPKHFHVEPDED